MLALLQLHHLFRGHRAPKVCRARILRPDLGLLRIVAMPWPRIEITQRFIFHLIEFGEEFGDEAARTQMIGEQIVADAVPSWPPKHPVAIKAQEVAGRLQMSPVTQLEGGVEMAVRAGADQVDGVVIDAAPQK